MDEQNQEVYYDVMEKQEEKRGLLHNIPKGVLIAFAIVLILVVAFLFKDSSNLKNILITIGIVIAVIILIAMQGDKSKRDYLGEEEIVPLAVVYLKKKINLLREEYDILGKGFFYLTGITCLREWDGTPWRWYIYFNCREEHEKTRWFGFVFDPYTGKCKGTEEYTSMRTGVEVPHVRVFIPFYIRQGQKYKSNSGGML